jgi:DNA repair exonuclease SbcCD nuclease subunit
MEPVKILHLADVHLDTAFAGRDEDLRRKLRAGVRQAFERAADTALERDVDAVLIAGDLFDSQRLSFATERVLLAALGRLEAASIPVFYATGNHDPGLAATRRLNLAWPQNTTVFSEPSPRTVPIHDRQGSQVAWLTAAGHQGQGEERNLARTFPRAREDLPHVAMLHAQVLSSTGGDAHERYAPCSELDLERPGFTYWALGHVHHRQRVSDRVQAWYPGNLQGRHPGEQGEKGCLYVELGPHGLEELEFIPLAPLVWHSLELDCPREGVSLEQLVSSLSADVRSRTALDGGRDHLVRLDLSGQSPLAAEISREDSLEDLCEGLKQELGALWVDVRPRGLVQPVDLEAYQGSATVLGEALDLLKELEQDPERVGRVLGGLELAGQGPGVDRTAYLRELIKGLDEAMASWMLNQTKS